MPHILGISEGSPNRAGASGSKWLGRRIDLQRRQWLADGLRPQFGEDCLKQRPVNIGARPVSIGHALVTADCGFSCSDPLFQVAVLTYPPA
jgi:hypothetical protein